MNILQLRPKIFSSGALHAIKLLASDIPACQLLFDANPDYFLTAYGHAAPATEAQSEFHDQPPATMRYTKKWRLAFIDDHGAMVGMANLWSDFMAPQVWQIGFFMIASGLHGSGKAAALYGAMEAWIACQGGAWMRLGVIQGYLKAEHFWRKMAYLSLRERRGMAMGARVHTINVMLKPLAGGAPATYLAAVPRDRPDHP